MTIKTQAFLQGYRREKTARRGDRGAAALAAALQEGRQDRNAGGQGTSILDWAKKMRASSKANREKAYTEKFNKDVARSIDPKSVNGERLIMQGQEEAAALRNWDVSRDGPEPTQNEWNKGPWENLGQPKGREIVKLTDWWRGKQNTDGRNSTD